MPNALQFQQSITDELNSIRNRVRHLIGDRHYGEDGRYKEAILKNVLRKFLPANISIGTGFIVKSGDDNAISRQLDIIIYDNTQPVLFSEGDFIITTPRNVKGVIEVKTRITATTLRNVIRDFDEAVLNLLPVEPLQRFSVAGQRRKQQRTTLFLGIFAFEFEGNFTDRNEGMFTASKKIVNHFALGPSKFIKKWRKEDGECLDPKVEATNDFYNIYNLRNLSFSYFISNLIDIVSGGLNDRDWFAFPIENTKESRRERTIFLG